MKIYIIEKGSDDAILFALDNANSIFEQNSDEDNSKIKAFCLENTEKN